MNKKYQVILTQTERAELDQQVSAGTAPARDLTHARILLKADKGPHGPAWKDEAIATALDTSLSTIARVRLRFVERGVTAAVRRRPPRREYRRKLDGEQEARLIAEVCGSPPDGHGRWSLRLLADRMVELTELGSLSYQTTRRVLERNELKPWLRKQWVIPPKANAEFVWRMEDVLAVYTRPYDPKRPQVCMDEISKQLLADMRDPLAPAPGRAARVDYEYERRGTANMFLFCEPLTGRRWVSVTDRRTATDWAHQIKDLVEQHYPDAEQIVLVADNLNTHTPAALYATFPPAEAKRLADKLEIHYTPKHGSWLNIAEIELSVLGRQCLDRRIPDAATLKVEVDAWQDRRNASGRSVDWRFTTDDARIKLKRLYPSIQE
ncbi:MAG: IS630 family transposase [Chloroflexota bacterium]